MQSIVYTRTYGRKAYMLASLAALNGAVDYIVMTPRKDADDQSYIALRARARDSIKWMNKPIVAHGRVYQMPDNEVIVSANSCPPFSVRTLRLWLAGIYDMLKHDFKEDQPLFFTTSNLYIEWKNENDYLITKWLDNYYSHLTALRYDIYGKMTIGPEDALTLKDIKDLIEELKKPTFKGMLTDPLTIEYKKTLIKKFLNGVKFFGGQPPAGSAMSAFDEIGSFDSISLVKVLRADDPIVEHRRTVEKMCNILHKNSYQIPHLKFTDKKIGIILNEIDKLKDNQEFLETIEAGKELMKMKDVAFQDPVFYLIDQDFWAKTLGI